MVCGDISIELKKEEESESYTVRDLLVTNNRVSTEAASKNTSSQHNPFKTLHAHTHPKQMSTRFD
jgi:hypothetical protein